MNKRQISNFLTITLGVTLCLAAVGGQGYIWVANGLTGYRIRKDTTDWLERAQVSSNPVDMEEYLGNCRDGLIKWNITSGHWAFIFKRPTNDMGLAYEALLSAIQRAQEIQTLNYTSAAYQSGIDDLRGTIREMIGQGEGETDKINPAGTYWVNQAQGRFWYACFGILTWAVAWLPFLLYQEAPYVSRYN